MSHGVVLTKNPIPEDNKQHFFWGQLREGGAVREPLSRICRYAFVTCTLSGFTLAHTDIQYEQRFFQLQTDVVGVCLRML